MGVKMVKKIRRMRTFAKTASKSMEKHLIQKATEIQKNPYIILPDYEDSTSKKYFKKIEKKIEKVEKYKDDPDKLEKLSNKRDIRGALAGTMLLAHSKKAPYLAVAQFPTGKVSYAKRGKAPKEHLISVQHFDDPILRVISLKNLALKKGLHLYSWDNGFVSTGDKPKPPKDFIRFIEKKLDYIEKSSCKHLDKKQVDEKKPADVNYLRIHWKSADKKIAICEKCARSNDKNTFFNITKYMVQPDITKDFEISVIPREIKGESSITDFSLQKKDEYTRGGIKDHDLIDENIKHAMEKIKESDEKIYILDGVSYGANTEKFIDALGPNVYEKKALQILLDRVNEPIVLNDVTPNSVLEKYWKKHGLKTLETITESPEMSNKLFQLNDPPSELVEAAINFKENQKILSDLPQYDSLPPLTSFADKIARTYKTMGIQKTIGEIRDRPDDTKGKSLAYAFLLAMEKGKDKKWKYSEVEVEYGEFLKDYAKKLLESTPKDYDKNLRELINATGASEKF